VGVTAVVRGHHGRDAQATISGGFDMGEQNLIVHDIHGVTVVDFSGLTILDQTTVESISRRLDELVEVKDRRKLLLEFSEVKFLSSSLLGALISLHKKVTARNGRIVITSLRPELQKVFKIAKIEKLFEFYDDEEPGLNSFGVYTA